MTLDDFRKRIDYSLCQQFASDDDACVFCERPRAARVGVACVNPPHVKLAAGLLKGAGIEVSGNVGFPFGSHFADVKVIGEAWVLTREEKERAYRLVEKAGAQTVKTTTGVRTQYLENINHVRRGGSSAGVPAGASEGLPLRGA